MHAELTWWVKSCAHVHTKQRLRAHECDYRLRANFRRQPCPRLPSRSPQLRLHEAPRSEYANTSIRRAPPSTPTLLDAASPAAGTCNLHTQHHHHSRHGPVQSHAARFVEPVRYFCFFICTSSRDSWRSACCCWLGHSSPVLSACHAIATWAAGSPRPTTRFEI
jgi:hypothetical protein